MLRYNKLGLSFCWCPFFIIPFINFIILWTINETNDIGILFEETAGKAVLAGSAIWMIIGVAVMRKMIAFDH